MEFRILGPLEVLDEGRAVPLGGSKQRALLAVLLLHANETLSTDRLIDELWGERPPATAAKTVQIYISRLRKALAGGAGNGSAGAVVTREHGYELELDPERLDAHRFERLVAEGRSELAAGRPERAASALEGALSLWRGPPLADLAYEPFAQREIARLDELRVAALEQLVEAKLALGAPCRAGGAAGGADRRASVPGAPAGAADAGPLPLGPPGRRAAGLPGRAQDAGRGAGHRAGRAAARARAGDTRAGPGDSHLWRRRSRRRPSRQRRPRAAAFVGRERELAELVGGLDDAFAGRGRAVPARRRARHRQEPPRRGADRAGAGRAGRECWSAAAGRRAAPRPTGPGCSRCGRTCAIPTRRAFEPSFATGPPTWPQLLPELRELLADLPPAPPLESEGARFRLFDSVTAFLKSVAAARPLVLVLDDLHAADEPSLLLLQFVARELGDSRLLIVGAYRDVDPTLADPLTTTLIELAREPVTRTLALAGLGEADVARFIELAAPERVRGGVGRGGARRDRGQPSVRRRDRAAARRGAALGRARHGAACDPAERERGDRPPSAPSLGRMQPASHPGLGARPRVRSRCAGGCQRTRAWRHPRVARRGDRGARGLGGARRDRPHALRPRPDPGRRLPRSDEKSPGSSSIGRSARPSRPSTPRTSTPISRSSRITSSRPLRAETARRPSTTPAGPGSRAIAVLAYEEAVRLYEMALEALGPDSRRERPAPLRAAAGSGRGAGPGRGRPGGEVDVPARGRPRTLRAGCPSCSPARPPATAEGSCGRTT